MLWIENYNHIGNNNTMEYNKNVLKLNNLKNKLVKIYHLRSNINNFIINNFKWFNCHHSSETVNSIIY